MANDYYNASGNPSTSSPGSSATMRAEFTLIEEALDKLPTLTANETIAVNAGGTALVPKSASEMREKLDLEYGTDVLSTNGVVGGQTVHGGTGSGDDLVLRATSNAAYNGVVVLNDLGGSIITGGPAGTYIYTVTHVLPSNQSLHLVTETASDADAGRQTGLLFSGTQASGTVSALARIVAEHDGAGADKAGRLLLKVAGAATAETERLRVDAVGIDVTGGCAITGALSKGSGTFNIDHPLDPENKRLVYGFVESPRYDLIHRGRAKLKNGKATISIDGEYGLEKGTFEALVQNPSVTSLCPVDSFERVKASLVTGDSFTIASEDPTSSSEVNWVVVAERNDPFIIHTSETDENGHLINEPEKEDATGEETLDIVRDVEKYREDKTEPVIRKNTKGFYLHPEAIGKKHPTRKIQYKVKNGKS